MARPVARPPAAEFPGLPQWIRPQLAQLVDAVPAEPDWLNEIKFDGYRMHARLDRGAVSSSPVPGSTGHAVGPDSIDLRAQFLRTGIGSPGRYVRRRPSRSVV